MKTPDEILKGAVNASKKLKESNDTITGINKIIDSLNRKPINDWDDEVLSNAMVQLSLYLVNLAGLISSARLVANASYSYRKLQKSTAYRKIRSEIDKKIGDAQEEAEMSVAQEIEDELLAQHRADELELYYDSISRLISTLQSRVKKILDERARSGLQT